MITKQELSSKWNAMARAVKQKYNQVTDDELDMVDGSVQHLIALLQQKTGQTRQQVEEFMSEVCEKHGSTYAQFCDTMVDYADAAAESLRDGYGQVSRRVQRGYEQSVDTMSSRPVISAGAALGVGLIVGVAIGLSIAAQRQPEPTWRDRWTR